jgi:hypothetical protein
MTSVTPLDWVATAAQLRNVQSTADKGFLILFRARLD